MIDFGMELTVLQVLVLIKVLEVLDELVLVKVVAVVLSSRQPHHPGVLQVSVRVLELVAVGTVVVVVEGLVFVPFSYFQRKQSTQSTSSSTQVAALS
jgi:hypothetical protein